MDDPDQENQAKALMWKCAWCVQEKQRDSVGGTGRVREGSRS